MFPPNKPYREIPIAIQDRSFNDDGSLFYPDTRAFFDEIEGPYIPDTDLSPIWNPEFFGNTIMVNGNTWPFQTVEQRRYRLRFLNGCQSRFLILDFDQIPGVEVWQIGNEGGFLASPVNLTAANGNRLLMGLAERADVIVDFTNVPLGNHVLGNVGPDEPFGGGAPGVDFPVADPATTGQIMQFRVVPVARVDGSTPPQFLQLPAIAPLPPATVTRRLALLEMMSESFEDAPAEALLGTVAGDPNVAAAAWTHLHWMGEVTENPAVGATEVWELYNATADAHPMHIHEITFEVLEPSGHRRRRGERDGSGHTRLGSHRTGAVGDRLQGHGDQLPGAGHTAEGSLRHARPVRLALPHRGARGQRDDAALPHRAGTARSARLIGEAREGPLASGARPVGERRLSGAGYRSTLPAWTRGRGARSSGTG